MAPAWADTAGRSSAPSVGCWRTSASACATTDATSSFSHCSRPDAYSWLQSGWHGNCENRVLYGSREILAVFPRLLVRPALAWRVAKPTMFLGNRIMSIRNEVPYFALADLHGSLRNAHDIAGFGVGEAGGRLGRAVVASEPAPALLQYFGGLCIGLQPEH